MTTELIETANRINRLAFCSRAGAPPDYALVDDLEGDALYSAFEALALDKPGPKADGQSVLPDPGNAKDRGEVLSAVVSRIARSYPFAAGYDVGPTAPLDLATADRVMYCLPELERRTQFLYLYLFTPGGTRLEEIAEAAAAAYPAEIGRIWREMLERFRQFVSEALVVTQTCRRIANRSHRYRRRHLPRIIAGAVVALVLFALGVAWPMVDRTAPNWADAWVPAMTYVLALAGVVFVLCRAFTRPR